MIKSWLREGWGKSRTPSVLMGLLILCVLLKYRQFLQHPLVLMTCIYGGVQIAVFAIRGRTVEARYLAPLAALLIMWLSVAVADFWGAWRKAHRQVGVAAILLTAGLLLFVFAPLRKIAIVRELTAEDLDGARYGRTPIHLRETTTRGSPVVSYTPCFYSFDTGEQALSIPTSDDEFLIRYMKHYDAHLVFLTDQEQWLWKPQSAGGSKLPLGIRVRAALAEGTLFERIDQP